MKSIFRDELKRYSFPGGALVVAVIGSEEQCEIRERYEGMDCVQLGDLREFAHSHYKHEPVLVHCTSQVDCHLAAQLLEYAGFENVYRYEGELRDLKPYARQEAGVAVVVEPGGPGEETSRSHSRGFEHLPPWVDYGPPEATREPAARMKPAMVEPRPWLDYDYGEARVAMPGYGKPVAGREEDRLRDEQKLGWAAIEDDLDIYVELAPALAAEAPPRVSEPRPWLEPAYSEAQTAMPGYAEPVAGREEYAEQKPGAPSEAEEEAYVELSEGAFRVEMVKEALKSALGPAAIEREQLRELIEGTPEGHLLLVDVRPPEACPYKEPVVCTEADDAERRFADVLEPRDVVVFRADDEREAEITYRRLQRTPAGAIYRYKGGFEEVLPEAREP